jgi:histidyl-tRNA synthetase
MIDEILDKLGLKYEDLNPSEKETFHSMLSAVEKSKLSPEKLQEYIQHMKYSIEEELSKEPEYTKVFIFRFRNDRNIFLKARLRNYMLLEAFLMTPEKAKEALERALGNITPVSK